ncbi:hypothetical protein B0H12DRAFT_332203 [Mycena haematopus]|nr:hypothetical protein B0H12DRAFT_332203 [Mycena haematopus]
MLGINSLESVIPVRPLLLLCIGFTSLYVVTRTTNRLRLFSPSRKNADTIHGTDIKISRILGVYSSLKRVA